MKKKWIISITIFLIVFAGGFALLYPRPIINIDEPITNMQVVMLEDNGVRGLEFINYDYTVTDYEYRLVLECLKEYSYHYSFGTLKNGISLIISNSTGIGGNDAGYWMYVYLDTATKRHTIMCSGTGEIMIDNGVYRVDYFGNSKQLEMMEKILSIVSPDEK